MMMLFDAIELQTSDNLLRRFEEIHNHLYANDGLSPEQALEEMTKLLFLKIVDERSTTQQFVVNDAEWSSIAVSNKSDSLEERIGSLFAQVKQEFGDIFDAQSRITLSPNALAWTVRALQSISLQDSTKDTKGLAFQKFLANRDKTGRGQFFTPEPVIDFCVKMVCPQPHEIILDPACGSGGFLLASMNFIKKTQPEIALGKYVSDNLVGCDISAGIARLAKMQLLLETDNAVRITCRNTLELSPEEICELHPKASEQGGYDIVFANPPFGTIGKITNRQLLGRFDLGYKWSQYGDNFHRTKEILNGQVTEVLFVERCLSLLREGGRMAIVLPNGHFENSSLAYLRAYIKQQAIILAIVHLPQETFVPFGTGVKTSLLFLEKRSAIQKIEPSIFFGSIKKIGYQGNKNATPIYKKDIQGHVLKDVAGKPLIDEDYTELAALYHRMNKGEVIEEQESNAFTLSPQELNGRFDFDFYSPSNRSLLAILRYHNAVKLSEIADIVREKSHQLYERKATVQYIELSDINTDFFEIIDPSFYAVHDLPSRASYEVKEGDILTAVAGNSIGTSKHATALALAEHEGCICTNGFRVLRNTQIDKYYLLYYLKTEMFLKQVFMLRTGAAIPSVSDSDIADILVYIPLQSAMESIVNNVREAFVLRNAARERLRGIVLTIPQSEKQ